MTYKHIDFSDSPTMRSLAKIANEKGWIKQEVIQKTASVKAPNLLPTANLTENLLKLCEGLKDRGFHKYAEELENKLLDYKRANVYDVSGETGDDLLEHAHPQGSHKMEDVDSDEAVFEDLIDKHLKTLKVVDKKPTGKLTNASSILNAVRVVLASSMQEIKEAMQQAADNVDKIIAVAEQGGGLTNVVMNWGKGRQQVIRDVAKKDKFTLNDLDAADSALNALERNFHPNALHNWLPDLLNKGVSSDEIWAKMEGFFGPAQTQINTARDMMKNIALDGETAPVGGNHGSSQATDFVGPTQNPVIGLGTTLIGKLKAYQTLDVVIKSTKAKQWIEKEIGLIQGIMQGYVKADATGQLDEVAGVFQAKMNEMQKEVGDFARQVKSSTT